MGVNGLGLAAIHKIEHATGRYVLRAWVYSHHNPHLWWFITDDHLHGVYDRRAGEWQELDTNTSSDSPYLAWPHTSICALLFGDVEHGESARTRDGSWGRWCHGYHGHKVSRPDCRWHAGPILRSMCVCRDCESARNNPWGPQHVHDGGLPEGVVPLLDDGLGSVR